MFTQLIAFLMSLSLSLTLSASASAQTQVTRQTAQAQSLQEEMRQMRQLMDQMRQLIERQEERISRLEPEKSASAAKSASTTPKAAPASNDTSPAAPGSGQQQQGDSQPQAAPTTAELAVFGKADAPATSALKSDDKKDKKKVDHTKVEAPSQPGSNEADKEARIDKVDKTDRADDVDNAGKSEKTGQSDKTNKGTAPAGAGQGNSRRAKPAPLDGIFPSSEYLGPTPLIGVPDTDPVYPLTEALWRLSPALKKARIKVYGWGNPGISASTSHNSNIPESYAIVPKKLELDQAILRFDRLPDTVQTEHVDWGFRFTALYGIDYRWTTSQGWFSEQLLKRNSLYGADPVEAYGLIYVPKVAKGMVIKIGRYISPPDIEAQLSPDNYLYTHSLMFTYDCYTQTGVNAAVKLNDTWSVLGGIHSGCDVAPWNGAAHPTGMFMLRWVSKSNNDSIYGGINSINNGHFKGFHDNLQQSNITWTHRFNEKGTFVTSTEAYYVYQSHALVGGTVNFGPPRPWFLLTGPGAPIPGNAPAIGVVNYTAIKLSKHNFITLRPIDFLVDVKGERTNFATTLSSWTVGLTHRFGKLITFRPEFRYEYAFNAKPWDNGLKNRQFMFAVDAIIRF